MDGCSMSIVSTTTLPFLKILSRIDDNIYITGHKIMTGSAYWAELGRDWVSEWLNCSMRISQSTELVCTAADGVQRQYYKGLWRIENLGEAQMDRWRFLTGIKDLHTRFHTETQVLKKKRAERLNWWATHHIRWLYLPGFIHVLGWNSTLYICVYVSADISKSRATKPSLATTSAALYLLVWRPRRYTIWQQKKRRQAFDLPVTLKHTPSSDRRLYQTRRLHCEKSTVSSNKVSSKLRPAQTWAAYVTANVRFVYS